MKRVKEEKVGEHSFLFTIAPVKGTNYINVYGNDITDLIETEEDLKSSITELERFKELTVGREEKMIELKRQINDLYKEKGKSGPYDLSFAE